MIDLLKDKVIELGGQGENLATIIQIDLAPAVAQYGHGSAVIIYQASPDHAPEIVIAEREGDVLTWIPTASQLAKAGYGRCEIRWYVGDVIAKSYQKATHVVNTITGEGQEPEELPTWLDTLAELVATSTENASIASHGAETATQKASAAAQSASDADEAKDDAVEASTEAKNAAVSAKTDADQAHASAVSASGSASSASDSAAAAGRSAEAARGYAQTIEGNINVAIQAKEKALEYAGDAQNAASRAESVLAQVEAGAEEAVAEAIEKIGEVKDQAIDDLNDAKDEGLAQINASANVQRITDLEADAASTKDSLTNLDGRVTTLENEPKVPEELLDDVAELKRENALLWKLNDGISYVFEESESDDYSKTVPKGAVMGDVEMIGGKSVLWSQYVKVNGGTYTSNGITFVQYPDKNSVKVTGTSTSDNTMLPISIVPLVENHIYYVNGGINTGRNSITIYTYQEDDTYIRGANFLLSGLLKASVNESYLKIHARIYSGITVDDEFKIRFVDITTIFGVTETSQVTDEMIAWVEAYASEHPEYNAGEIISADVESVDVQGRNLFNPSGAREIKDYSAIKFIDKFETCHISITNKDTDADISGCYLSVSDGPDYSSTSGANFTTMVSNGVLQMDKHVTSPLKKQRYIAVYPRNDETWEKLLRRFNISVVYGNTALPFSPYHKESIEIPEEIRKLPGFGWSAGTAYNRIYRDGDKWWYEQNITKRKIKEASMVRRRNQGDFWLFRLFIEGAAQWAKALEPSIPQILCADYLSVRMATIQSDFTGDKVIRASDDIGYEYVEVVDKQYNDADEFMQAKGETEIYYKLATPILTDITDLVPKKWLEDIDMETGGSITFVNDSILPVPNKEDYCISLKEVQA